MANCSARHDDGSGRAFEADARGLAGAERNRYVDPLRVLAIGGVVYGHWLLISPSYSSGPFSSLDTLDYVAWGRWITWASQVMPVFFLAGGYANALSWTAHHAQGERWNWWIQRRAMRLWWPTAAYLGVNVLVMAALTVAGVCTGEHPAGSYGSCRSTW